MADLYTLHGKIIRHIVDFVDHVAITLQYQKTAIAHLEQVSSLR